MAVFRAGAVPLLLLAAVPCAGAEAPAAPPAKAEAAAKPPAQATLCGALEAAAARNGLPFAFFTRLIWQESRFDPGAVSPAGARGVAQFMPATAAERGLADPFEPARALDESAAYLKDLRRQFGNLGLAAAAYNAGPGRLARWLAGTGGLPAETVSYVLTVTGRAAEDWRAVPAPALPPEPGFSCVAFAGAAGRRRAPAASDELEPGTPPPKPWAVILVASFNRVAVTAETAVLRAKLARAFDVKASSGGDAPAVPVPVVRRRHLGGEPAKKYVVQLETDDRAAGNGLCKRFEATGGNCVVLRNLLR